MITKITLNKVATYKNPTELETDKKINLIYGLNGTGKSTFSNFLYSRNEEIFKDSKIEGIVNDDGILVYNQKFIQDNFFESETLKGIFSLSKINKEAEEKITNAKKKIVDIDGRIILNKNEIEKLQNQLQKKNEAVQNEIWKIKQKFTESGSVFDFCLDGLKRDKSKLFSFITKLKKPNKDEVRTQEELTAEINSFSGGNANKYELLDLIPFLPKAIEEDLLFQKQIVGNENSTISELILKLQNSDWVKEGLEYLQVQNQEKDNRCPFCQEKLSPNILIEKIESYFDETFEKDIDELKSLKFRYDNLAEQIKYTLPSNNYLLSDAQKNEFNIKYNIFTNTVKNNKQLIVEKLESPSKIITLKNSESELTEVNAVINKINTEITEHNEKLDKKELALKEIKNDFWRIMRWDYDSIISTFTSEEYDFKKTILDLGKSINEDLKKVELEKEIIATQQKLTINIQESIDNINNGLIDLGIDDFQIEQYSENLYKIVRGDHNNRVFHSLSEGEKMIISFLYFLELCRGIDDIEKASTKKTIVIDDPISSLSHIYVFNIGRLIKNEFFKNDKYEQLFLLTHNLYFFYEMTETKHDLRNETQKLFRISKNSIGSTINEMKYQEIQNDYQSYWYIIKDEEQPPALIANCMRNIIEYFFNFVEKQELNNVFDKKEMKEIRFQAFYRYVNRESHSLGQNIFDIKEFDYAIFREAFALVFRLTGYEDHYKKMIK